MKAKCLLLRAFLTLNLVGWILLLDLYTVQAAPPKQGGIVYHQVARGENLTGIAARYGTTVSTIAQRNGIANPNRIYVGQRLVIPTAFAASRSSSVPSPSGPRSASCTHRIVPGDTLSKIAVRYNTTVQHLMSANGLSSTRILAGGTLRVPCVGAPRASPAVKSSPPVQSGSTASCASYRVRPGDTLSSIAHLYRTTVQAIMTANSFRNPHHIYAGQVLRICLR